jgi:MoxR-like ATPase
MELKKQDWWVYQGDKSLEDVQTPPWRETKVEKEEKKKQEQEQKGEGKEERDTFVPLSPELVDAVNAAIHLRRPLLVTGEPGIGKSSLAKSIAKNLKTELLHWQITSRSVVKDALYSYDTLKRLHDIQMKKLYYEIGEREDADDEIKAYESIQTGIENYLKLTSLGSAFVSDKPVVVIIDEIDKSDRDLPNDLLHIFEEQEFEIDELKRMQFEEGEEPLIENSLKEQKAESIPNGRVVCKKFPIIVMTSNGEQTFPPAFLRRCISVEMKLVDKQEVKQLTKIVESHFPDKVGDSEVKEVVESFVALKKEGLRSNDQLLNALWLILDNKEIDFETFKTTLLKSIE